MSTTAAKKNATPEMNIEERRIKCQTIIRSGISAAGQLLSVVPVDLLRVDDAYQRQIRCSRWNKIASIANNWNNAKANSLLVSYREDSGYFFVIDGQGRLQAALQAGLKYLLCQVITGIDVKEEAELFLSQDESSTKVTLQQKVKAGIVAEHTDCLRLKSLMNKYNIESPEEIRAIGTALDIVAKNPTELDWIFGVLRKVGWDTTRRGYSRTIMKSLHELYNRNYKQMAQINEYLIPMMAANSPEVFQSVAQLIYGSQNKMRFMCLYSFYAALISERRTTLYNRLIPLQMRVPVVATGTKN